MQISRQTKFLFSISHFFNTGFFVFVLAFFPLYAEKSGFSAVQIGILNIWSMVASMLSSPLVLTLAGSRFSPSLLLRITSLFAPLLYFLMLLSSDFILFIFCWTIFVGLRGAGGTLIDVQLIRNSARGALRFEYVRTWGSVGFVVLGFLLGFLFDRFDNISVVQYLLLYVIFQSALCFYVSNHLEIYEIPENRITFKTVFSLLRDSRILGLFISISLIWLSHAPFYVYFSLYLQDIGWTSTEISWAWNLGVLAEILFFLIFRRLSLKNSMRTILLFSMSCAVLRWMLLGYSSDFYLILFSQMLHAFTFGGCYLVSIHLTHEWFPRGLKEKSQGLLVFFGQGLGSLAGRWFVSFLAGYYADYAGFSNMFYASSIVALLAFMVCFTYCKERK
jgi:PPP family 3-phenylpropionic acid transporter